MDYVGFLQSFHPVEDLEEEIQSLHFRQLQVEIGQVASTA